MSYEYKTVLILEPAENAGGFTHRAIILDNPNENTNEFQVKTILEYDNINTLRDAVNTSFDVTHYRPSLGEDYLPGDWSDALRVAKDKAYEEAISVNADVRKNMTLRHLVNGKNAAVAAQEERERLDAEREQEQQDRANERKERAAERADFDAWSKLSRAARKDDKDDYTLGIMMRWAFNEVDSWEETLEEHIEKLKNNSTYALSWSGNFVQASANHDVAQELVAMFKGGASFEGMRDAIMRTMFNRSDRAMSRSTSVMSNITEDATRAAWTEAAKRISGNSIW